MATEEELTRLRLDPQREKFEARQRAEKYAQETDEDLIKLNLDQARNEYNLRMAAEQEEREPYSTKPQKKMGLIFVAFAGILCVVGDAIDLFTAGTIGWLIGLFIDAILALMFGLSSAGRKQFKRMAVGLFGESIPIIAMFPLRTGFLCWAFISSRSKIARKVGDRIEHQVHRVTPAINVIKKATQPTKTLTPSSIKKTANSGQGKMAA